MLLLSTPLTLRPSGQVFDAGLDVSLNYALPVADWIEPYVSAGILAANMSGAALANFGSRTFLPMRCPGFRLTRAVMEGEFNEDMKSELLDKNPPSCPEGTPQYRTTTEVWPTPLLSLPSLWLAARVRRETLSFRPGAYIGAWYLSALLVGT